VRLALIVAAALSAATTVASNQRDFGSAEDALERGDYRAAEDIAVRRHAEVVKEFGDESLEAARAADDLVQTRVRNGKAGMSGVVELANRTIQLKERYLGPGHSSVAVSLHNLADVRFEHGEFDAALPLHERALSLRRALAASPGDIAESLEHVVRTLIRMERFADASKLLAEARAIRERGGETTGVLGARVSVLNALLHRYDGEYALAWKPLDEALGIYREVAPEHPDRISALQLRGELLFLTGDVIASHAVLTEALERSQRVLGDDHALLPRMLRWLALADTAKGDLRDARSLLDRAIPIASRWLAPCHPEVAGLSNDLGNLTMLDGDYRTADREYGRALAIREKCLGPKHSLTATIIHNRALLAAEMGDFADAIALHRKAIGLWSAVLGAEHPYVARGLDFLAEVLFSEKRLSEARRTHQRALIIRQKRLGKNNPEVAWTLSNLARVAAASGNLTAARAYITGAIDIYRQGGLPNDPDHVARTLKLLGGIELQHGTFDAAHSSFREAVTVRERLFGAAHPLVADSRADLAAAEFALGAHADALASALEAERSGREHLLFTVRYLPERQAIAYADRRPRGLDLALSVVSAPSGVSSAPVLDAVIRSRAVILDELIGRARMTAQRKAGLTPLNAAVVAARERFANLMVRRLLMSDPVPPGVFDRARRDREQAERHLVESNAAAGDEVNGANVGLEEVRRHLPPQTALVSFVRYDRTTISARGGIVTAPSYMAFVIGAGSTTVHAVPLGPAAVVDSLVGSWQREARGPSLNSDPGVAELAYRNVARELRRNTWDKIAGAIGSASYVFVIADGTLNLVNFAALPGKGGGYLVEDGLAIHYLSAERDLFRSGEETYGRGLLAVGGPAFGDESRTSPAVAALRRRGCVPRGGVQFSSLPGTLDEVRDIVAVWPDRETTKILTGANATESAVKASLAGRRVVHVATHGFFLSPQCDERSTGTRAVGGVSPASSIPMTGVENPLLLAGLVFAGANRRIGSAAQDDGILTAEEIAGLDLQGTEWAVLSACDTGIGVIKAGEGVFGLRRAFQIAGARTVVMSLWSVDDLATRTWMRSLYEGRLRHNLSTAAAVHRATLEVLRNRRAAQRSTHPFYWAAFVAAGDWQ
jgi:CHAT domain-containing protein/tetratricopeptide (TPR) repeat protein